MLTRFLTVLLLTTGATTLFAQQAFNTTLRDNLTFPSALNDVWGYVAPDGTEYALVGRNDGVSIVSLADPDDIEEVAFIAGDQSTWRDLKTFGEYAYVVADEGDDGILVIDLSNLPTSVSSTNFVAGNTPRGALVQAHNIYIDEPTGLAYLAGESGAGSRLNSGGMVIFDVATTPGTPTFVAFAPSVYAHDVYVQNGVMYASEIFEGELTLYDVSNPQNITEIGVTNTPFFFTHNAWTETTGDIVFTTDERGNAPVAAYDVSNPLDIQLLDEFRPNRSVGSGVIPHNTHVLDGYLITSYYTDGVEIVDASDPENMVEIAYYDSWTGGDGGFNGSWGAYPFLPSGLVLSSDITGGLDVVEVNYRRAARLRGVVTDSDTGDNLNNVQVTISSPLNPVRNTDALGRYKTGIPSAGTFTVTYSLAGYNTLSFPLTFENGVEIVQDTFLIPKTLVGVSGSVVSATDNSPIELAEVRLDGEDGSFTDQTDAGGNVSFNPIFTGEYEAYAGIWGFADQGQDFTADAGGVVSFQLAPGFRDGFAVDQGWTVSGAATTGAWERGVPVGTSFSGSPSNPGVDANGDVGNLAYVTGNGGGGAGNDDVDGGNTVLTSPIFDPADIGNQDILLTYDYWFFNDGGSSNPDDEMTVSISNGIETEVIRTYDNNTAVSAAWTTDNFAFSDLSIAVTDEMQVIFNIGDNGGGHLVEGGVDNFSLTALATLPVTLRSFTATAIAKQTASLEWVTEEENNASHFAVQRSADGINFATIGEVVAVGESTVSQTYSFVDADAAVGANFYRLEQVDRDGSSTLSEVRLVSFTESEELVVYPNPVRDHLRILGGNAGAVEVYESSGRLVRRYDAVGDGWLNVAGLVPGIYWIRVGTETLRIIKR
ncbi:MAG: choice-of-anchor B family protein [Bacteroidota bacterium]